MLKDKNIFIMHFRVGKTDGVSLEIEAWKNILISTGAKIKLISGPINFGADYIIPDLEQQLNPEIYTIDEESFNGLSVFKSHNELKNKILKKQKIIENELNNIIKKTKPDYLIVSNIFSVGENIPAAGALAKAIVKTNLKTLAVHHDFYWEEVRYKNPTSDFIKNQLDTYFPFIHPLIKHCTINSIAQRTLKKKKQINPTIFYDTIDYKAKPWAKKKKVIKLLKKHDISVNDLFVLQATRIIRRKNIELSIDFVAELNKRKDQIIFDNRSKKFNPKKNRIVLVLAGYAEKRDSWYLEKLIRYAAEKKVSLRFIGNDIYGAASDIETGQQIYELWDIYPFADIITYPSCYEGFGNQFLEATFAKKPVVIYEYPVFKTDIKPKGFEIISLGNKVSINNNGLVNIPENTMDYAIKKTIRILNNEEKYQKMVNKNFKVGKNNFSYEETLKLFKSLLSDC
jgi:glycosyltransferase involved in cell wall biosynthesis